MKKNKTRFLALILAVLLSLMTLGGCGNTASTGQSAGTSQTTETTAATKTITDMAGRQVEVPSTITKVYSSSPVGSNFMYTFDDKMMIGINYDLSSEEKQFTSDYYQSLPNLGGWYGKGNEGNVEEIIKAAPDIVLSSGTDESSISTAETLQEKLGVPVVLINTDNFDQMAASYRFLGELFGDTARGEELASYTEKTYADVAAVTASIPEDQKVTVYYAEEQAGLNTDPSGSTHSRLIDLCGGINVAECAITKGYGRTEVSMEQVLAWNPQYIIACVDNGYSDSGSYQTILSDSNWANIQAVKDGHVYQTPTSPQNWFDRPPSCNTIIGLKWVQNLLYPQYANYNIKDEAKEFYKLFYHYELTDEEVNTLLQYSLRNQ